MHTDSIIPTKGAKKLMEKNTNHPLANIVPKPIAEFRVKPSQYSKLFYTTKVFKSSSDLQKYAIMRSGFKKSEMKNTRGLASGWRLSYADKRGKDILVGDAGEILLADKYLRSHIIVHECTHAALGLMRRKKVDISPKSAHWVGDGEEWVCDAVGNMSAQIFGQLTKRKLW